MPIKERNMYRLYTIFIIALSVIFEDWHARMVFMARAYPRRYGHGKSWNRAHKHYKENWTLVQRLLWIPLFKEAYEEKYRLFAFLSYIQSSLALITSGVFLVCDYFFPDSKFWVYVFVVYAIFFMLRVIYTDYIARGKIRWW